MSLLLEALKKAELAKQAAKEQPPASDKPPFTRDKLPDISQPMEIRSEDLSLVDPAPAPKREEKPALELALEEPPRAAPPPPPPPPPRAAPVEEPEFTAPAEAVERKQAQQLFEAKEMDVNPRKPFYITLAALGVFALGAVGYIWYEMQPKNNYKIPPPSAQPAEPAPAAPPVAAAPSPEPAAPAATTVTPPAGSPTPAPLAAAPSAAPAQAAPAATQVGVAPPARSAAQARQATPATATRQQPAPKGEGDIRVKPAQLKSDPVLMSAYEAYNAGDMERSQNGYQEVLRTNPDNRDALLGLAAIAMQSQRFEAAERYYARLLELDPRDAHAQAGMIGLKGSIDPVTAESRLKTMIAGQPEAVFLNFTLGNQYAAQGLWAEAQQAYFSAYTGNPEHPDFAYNLAVSLDKLHQSKPALEYYQRALALARKHPATFDSAQVSKRVSQLAH